ncbi:flavoprotein [Nocardia sp. NBC_00511]|uniref:flavoprotein n=1 Tax=Nocardia sp. NBC_00511 TaxID=2903591 RepID=UPI0030E44AE3
MVTGSPAAKFVGRLVGLAQGVGWDVCVVASPDGMRFIDVGALEAQTGHTVRSVFKEPGTPDVLPPADAMIVAPLTGNSLAKWACGIADTLPLAMLVEAVGMGLPVAAAPMMNAALIKFPAHQDSIRKLSDWGVSMLVDRQPDPGMGAEIHEQFPWERVWQAVLRHPRMPDELAARGLV